MHLYVCMWAVSCLCVNVGDFLFLHMSASNLMFNEMRYVSAAEFQMASSSQQHCLPEREQCALLAVLPVYRISRIDDHEFCPQGGNVLLSGLAPVVQTIANQVTCLLKSQACGRRPFVAPWDDAFSLDCSGKIFYI